MRKFISLSLFALTIVACAPSVVPTTVSVLPVPNSVVQYDGSINVDDTVGKTIYTINDAIESVDGYTIKVSGSGINVEAKTPVGLMYARQTISQLVDSKGDIAFVDIIDAPQYEYRGLMLDVSRHFQDKEAIKHILDLMHRYKLNRFHWHLTDDQGWRIEIKKYPLLTEKGAYRKFNNHDRWCKQYETQYDEPDFQLPEQYLKVNGADTLYGGFYTQDDIREVVAYAKDLGIEVIPELDMPGHLMAAIIGYPYISCKGKAQWGASFSDPLCIGNDKALQMVKDIYSEVAELFPYDYLHLGADEVEHTNWKACAKCQAKIKSEGLSGVEELQAFFVRDMEKHFNSLGKKLMGWDEIIMGGLSPTATITWWRNWAPEVPPTATAQGNKVIICPSFRLYFDAWEDENTLRNTYEYNPVEGLNEAQVANILGVQGNLWCETVPSMRRIENQYFPRTFALAEMAWSKPEQRVYEEFLPRMIKEVQWLDANGINYRVPSLSGFADVNVFIDSAMVTVNSILPDVDIRYTTDGTNPNSNSTLYSAPFKIGETTNFIFRPFRPDGTPSEMFKARYSREGYSVAADVEALKDGINVVRYNFKGRTCKDIKTKGRVVERFVADSLNYVLDNTLGWGDVGLIASGYIDVPQDAIYEFALTSDDGSMLYVDGVELIDFDGPHGAKTKKAQRAMASGLHLVEVHYFENNNGGSLKLELDGVVINNYKH